MREIFEKIFASYGQAINEKYNHHPVADFIRQKFPEILLSTNAIDTERYSVKASAGLGNWSTVPWLCVFDKNITETTMEGVYIVYLFASDYKTVYLTLEQGSTSIRKTKTKTETIKQLIEDAENIRRFVDGRGFSSDTAKLDVKSSSDRTSFYGPGAIYFKTYTADSLPSNEVLIQDLKNMLLVYQDYASFLAEHKEKELDVVLENVNIPDPLILYGPPGTGKTYRMQHKYIDSFSDKQNCFVTTFHQSFTYEDFVEGLKPVLNQSSASISYRIEHGIFYQACEQAAKIAGFSNLQDCIKHPDRKNKMQTALNNNKCVLLCIDEINRANVSSVFGDLISLIEPSKRIGAKNELSIILPYSKKEFAVPQNLIIVGTMNTADRSIQLLDSALRRRFKFEQLLPSYDIIENDAAREMLMKINARIRCLLDKDHQIGHSVFIDKNTNLEIFSVLINSVIPLLEEYFYNDTLKIRQVLNEYDTKEKEYLFYVPDEDANLVKDEFDLEMDEIYELNPALDSVTDDETASLYLAHLYTNEIENA